MVQSVLLGRAGLEKASLGHEELLKGQKAWVLGNADAMKLGARDGVQSQGN